MAITVIHRPEKYMDPVQALGLERRAKKSELARRHKDRVHRAMQHHRNSQALARATREKWQKLAQEASWQLDLNSGPSLPQRSSATDVIPLLATAVIAGVLG